jgi:hypothetical protein
VYGSNNLNLDVFKEQSTYTDPGNYAFLYEGLPSSPEDISDIIHKQLIHPAAVHVQNISLTKEQMKDEKNCQTMKEILKTLQGRKPVGFSLLRKPEHRVVNNCCGHALFMASVLKNLGIPARLRCGFAPYLFDGFSCDHTIVEVWMDGRWRLMDADATNLHIRNRGYNFNVYDIPYELFDFGWEAWQRVRQEEDPIERYRIPGGYSSLSLLHKALIRDLLAIFGQEIQVWYCPPFKDVPDERIHPTLDRIAELMERPDDNLKELKLFYDLIDAPRDIN